MGIRHKGRLHRPRAHGQHHPNHGHHRAKQALSGKENPQTSAPATITAQQRTLPAGLRDQTARTRRQCSPCCMPEMECPPMPQAGGLPLLQTARSPTPAERIARSRVAPWNPTWNQCCRSAEDPCVQLSGLTARPLIFSKWSSPTDATATHAACTSPGSRIFSCCA